MFVLAFLIHLLAMFSAGRTATRVERVDSWPTHYSTFFLFPSLFRFHQTIMSEENKASEKKISVIDSVCRCNIVVSIKELPTRKIDNEEFLKKIGMKRALILGIAKGHLKFLGNLMSKKWAGRI